MLNYQRTIIFCVLFIAVWVQSSKAVTAKQKRLIKYLEDSLNRANAKQIIAEGGINHFNSWTRWPKIAEDEKLRIAINYKNKLEEERLNFKSGTNDKLKDLLAMLAYTALDDYVSEELEDLEVHLKNNPATVKGIKDVAKNGQYLDYVAYYYEQCGSELVQKEADKFKETIKYEATRLIWAILPPYLTYRRLKPVSSTSK